MEKTGKILTLIIPSYNMEKYLDRCLSSLIVDKGKMALVEVLVINDGSKDRTSEIGHNYESRFPDTFHVIDKENGHYGSCINSGLVLARGKYVKVLDADDYFSPSFADFLSFLEEADAELVLSDSISQDGNGNELSRITFPLPSRQTMGIDSLLKNGISHLNHFNITYRTHILKEMEYHQTEGFSYTDLEWVSLPLCKVSTVAYCPVILYCYLRGRVGQTVDISYRRNNMWMEDKVVLGLAGQYEVLKDSLPSDNAFLFKALISSFIEQIYSHYLVNYPKDLRETDLVKFDISLYRTSKELYGPCSEAKDMRKFGTFYYIRDFRKKGTRKQIKFIFYDICRAAGSLYGKIKKI